LITDAKEKKELIQNSIFYETTGRIRFESERVAPGSFVSGQIWYSLSGSAGSVEADLVSDNGFKLRKPGEEKEVLSARLLTFLGIVYGSAAASFLLIRFRFFRRPD